MTETPMNPIETKFYQFAIKSIPGLVPQYWIGQYRVDFAIPDDMIVVEIDSKTYHPEHQRLYHDKPRQRAIEAQGWTVVRMEAVDVQDDVRFCLRRVMRWQHLKRQGLHIERIFPT